ncbi:hypothetical protein ACHAXR_012419 [Thalassiosira sp. AJA248-18]
MAKTLIAAPWLCFLCALSDFAQSFSTVEYLSTFTCNSRHDQKLYSINYKDDYERRSFLKKSASLLGGLVTTAPANALDNDDPSTRSTALPSFDTGNFDCLLDLPPITPGCARLYLCRHGQTENNRLKLVQGARVDPSINRNGYEQAQRLGMAVSKLTKSSTARGAVPTLAVHSNLRRARETAQVVTSTVSSQSSKDSTLKIFGEQSSLGEVDFGSLEGIDVKYFRRSMRNTVANWSIGNIDKRTGGGGESGRELLERAAQTLDELSMMAMSSTSSSSILAVSHSAYLRILLSLVGDTPLVESVLWKIQNGSVNVVDVNVEGKRTLVTSNSGIFGGEIVGKLKGSNGLKLEMPEAHLIRRNEARHLDGMEMCTVDCSYGGFSTEAINN